MQRKYVFIGIQRWAIGIEPTQQQAAAPTQSLEFLFWGAGIVVFPVVLIYTGLVYWIFRGKTGKVA